MNINDWKTITKEELLLYFKKGIRHTEIAKIYNISTRAVYLKIKTLNLNIERKNKSKIDKTIKICTRCGCKYRTSKWAPLCARCASIDTSKDSYQESNTELSKQIIGLRKSGKSFKEIAKRLNCSASTVAYYCSPNSKNLSLERNKVSYSWRVKLRRQISDFQSRKIGIGKPNKTQDWNKKFRSAVSKFKHRKMKSNNKNYTYKDVLNAIGGTKQKCYLTGRPIDLEKDNYNLDHKIPISKGGTNDISNLGITCPEANASKSDLTIDEYISLCKEVLLNFGYKVINP